MRRIENRVEIPDGTAAVYTADIFVDENRSLGNREGRICAASYAGVSQKTCFIFPFFALYEIKGYFSVQKIGCAGICPTVFLFGEMGRKETYFTKE